MMPLLLRRDPRHGWTSADYESELVLTMTGHRDAVALVRRARAPHPVRRAVRAGRRFLRRDFRIGVGLRRGPAH